MRQLTVTQIDINSLRRLRKCPSCLFNGILSPCLANHLFLQVIYMGPEKNTLWEVGVQDVQWGGVCVGGVVCARRPLIWSTDALLLKCSIFKIGTKGLHFFSHCHLLNSADPALPSLNAATSSTEAASPALNILRWHVVNNLVSSGKVEKEQKKNFSMATNKYYKLQGTAHPNNMKRCSQNSGRSGPIKQNVCYVKRHQEKQTFILKQMHSENSIFPPMTVKFI